MYNAHWIHSLPYSKFIELTLNNILFVKVHNFIWYIIKKVHWHLKYVLL